MAHRALVILLALAAGIAVVPGSGLAQDEAAREVPVRKVTRAAVLATEGNLLALARSPVTFQPRAYRGEWVVASVLEPGTLVRRGEVLVSFEEEKVRREMEDARFDLERATIGLRHQERNAELTRASTAEDTARMERDLEETRLRLERWTEHDQPIAREDARLSEASWKSNIDDAREELKELERMYSEDELVEATEELVLKRSRRDLEQRLASFENYIHKRRVALEYDESRRAEALRFDLEMKQRAFARRSEQLEMQERDRGIGLEASRRDLEGKQRRLDDLRSDMESLRVRAPRDGVLLHGADVTDDKRIEPGDRVNPTQAFVTVVDPHVLTVRFKAPAAKRLSLATGQEFEVTPKVDGAATLHGRVERMSLFAGGDQTLTLDGRIEVGDDAPGAFGGVACSVRLRTGTEEVLVVPAEAIRKSDQGSFCRVRREDGTLETREVKPGETTDDGVVVTEGLREGERVLVGGTWK